VPPSLYPTALPATTRTACDTALRKGGTLQAWKAARLTSPPPPPPPPPHHWARVGGGSHRLRVLGFLSRVAVYTTAHCGLLVKERCRSRHETYALSVSSVACILRADCCMRHGPAPRLCGGRACAGACWLHYPRHCLAFGCSCSTFSLPYTHLHALHCTHFATSPTLHHTVWSGARLQDIMTWRTPRFCYRCCHHHALPASATLRRCHLAATQRPVKQSGRSWPLLPPHHAPPPGLNGMAYWREKKHVICLHWAWTLGAAAGRAGC